MNRSQLLFSVLLAVPLPAQGLWIGPGGPQPVPTTGTGPGTDPRLPPVRIVRTAVHADIVDGVATTTVDQVIHNDGARDAEGTWFLPLPGGAVADAFTMTVGGKEIAGEVLDAGQARTVYENIVRKRRDPGLLEYAGEGLLRARIFPIPAGGDVGVTVRVRQVLQPIGGIYEWTWPVRAAGMGDASVGPIGLDVRIESQTTLSTVIAPYANAEVKRAGDRVASVSVEGQAGQFEDLKVLYGLSEHEFGLHLLPYRLPGEPGWFTLLLSPPRSLAADKAPPRRCVQFVVDTSGSMAGDKIEQAKAAVRTFLRSLRPDDLFQVISFASTVQPFFTGPQRASRDHIDAALRCVDSLTALGGTNISGALEQALAAAAPAGDDGGVYLQQIVFVTDGQPTIGLTNPQQILELTRRIDSGATRVFALGVGDDIDVPLIDDLVQQHRGARDFVRNKEKIEAKVDALCQKIAQPALADVEVRCDGLDASDVHPARTRDLFCGELLQVVGRYRNSGKQIVRVTGKQNGVVREFVFEVDFPAVATQHSFVQTLWARQHIASLLDAIRHNGQKPELVDEVKRLATQYGIVTRYTSQLIVEEGMRLAGEEGLKRGPGDGAPGGSRDGNYRGPATGGRGLAPSSPVPSGPTTGSPAGPATDGSAVLTLKSVGRARTGAEAVEESLEAGSQDSLHLGAERRAESKDASRDAARQMLRRAAGRVFVSTGDDLVEQGLPADWAAKAVVVEAFGDAYFELLRQQPQLRAVLALGDRVVFRDGGRIVHVKPAAPVVKPPAPATGPEPAIVK